MKICKEDFFKEIKNIVQTKAKYQKVMLLFDENVSSIEIANIYNNIKELCIYNQCNIDKIDINEIYNGYRLLIYYCNAEKFLNLNIQTDEFVNVFCPISDAILPFFLNNNNLKSSADNYLIIDNSKLDISMMTSMCFNKFYHYISGLLGMKNKTYNFDINNNEITQYNTIKTINEIEEDLVFIDVDILKKTKLSYKYLPLIDLILINAFLLVITSIKNQNYMLVDVYKSVKEDESLIEKFYKLYNNETFTNIIILNYNCLYNYCIRTKQKILECFNIYDISQTEIEKVITMVKDYAKKDTGLLSYTYLYNVFSA